MGKYSMKYILPILHYLSIRRKKEFTIPQLREEIKLLGVSERQLQVFMHKGRPSGWLEKLSISMRGISTWRFHQDRIRQKQVAKAIHIVK